MFDTHTTMGVGVLKSIVRGATPVASTVLVPAGTLNCVNTVMAWDAVAFAPLASVTVTVTVKIVAEE